MKKINLIIVVMICSIHSMAQQKLKTNVADIGLPTEVNKATKEETLKLLSNKYKRTKFFRDYKNIYTSNGIIVCFEDIYKSEDPLPLEQHKNSTEAIVLRGGDKIIDSKIITINNIKFFVMKYQDGDEFNLNFTPDFKNNATVFCTVKYKKEDESRAEKLFNTLLNNFRYKN